MKLFYKGCVGCALFVAGLKAENLQSLSEAQRLFAETNYAAAAAELQGASDGVSQRLLGRCYSMLNDLKRATDTLEKAVESDPKNAEGYLWLGEAYGLRAQSASVFSAAPLAIKTRESLEKAYSLDPKNWDAASDLFEFYLEAPGFMGGGLEKASKMAAAISLHDPAEGAVDGARVHEKRKDFEEAEKQFRNAISMAQPQAPQQAARHADLARFFAHRGRYADSDEEFAQAFHFSPNNPKIIYACAETLIQSNRKLPEAKDLLTRYLSLKLTPDDPSRETAEKLLKKASGS